MALPPRQSVSEFVEEAKRTSAKYLVVEGPSDRAFYFGWLSEALDAKSDAPFVLHVDTLEIDTGLLFENGLNDGTRSRVIYVSKLSCAASVDVLSVADLDCGHGVAMHSNDRLLWTDFPALESYGFEAKTMDALNSLFLGGRLPPAAELIEVVSPVLLELYAVRANNEHLPSPSIAKGFDKKRKGISFDVRKAVAANLSVEISTYERPTFPDQRSHAYGHDVAEVLLAMFANAIVNGAKVPSREPLEAMIRASMLLTRTFATEGLFRRIVEWAGGYLKND